jgi:hypothetical protein
MGKNKNKMQESGRNEEKAVPEDFSPEIGRFRSGSNQDSGHIHVP